MKRTDIIAGLLDPAPAFICENLNADGDKGMYRVPLTYVNLLCTCGDLPGADVARASIRNLPEIPNAEQFRAVFRDGNGLGLFLPTARQESGVSDIEHAPGQDLLGSIVLFPSHEWAAELDAMSDWFTDGADEIFNDLPYALEDIAPFAGVNYSPDRWYVVLRGPMTGAICWWTHDGDSEMDAPWASDLKAWADRIWAELPDVLGGTNRFAPVDTIDQCPDDAELYPTRFVRDLRARGQ